MNTTDEIMAMAEEYACAASTVTELNYEKWHSDTARTAKLREQVSARQALRAAIVELVEQANWAHHTPKLLTDEDATADLAGVPRPGAEPHAYAVYFPDEDREELVHKLDDLLDDLTNCTHKVTPLHTAPPQASQPSQDAMDAAIGLLSEVSRCFVCDDDLPDRLLPRIDALLMAYDAAIAAQKGKP